MLGPIEKLIISAGIKMVGGLAILLSEDCEQTLAEAQMKGDDGKPQDNGGKK